MLASHLLEMLLHLVPCNDSDPWQQWRGVALQGKPAALQNVGSKLCLSEIREQPAKVVGLSSAACNASGSELMMRRGSGEIILASSGQCLEAAYERGVQGVYFLYSDCYGNGSPSYADQRFKIHRSGLVESVSLPGFCMHADQFELPTLPVQPGAVISHGFGDMNIAFHFANSAGLAGVCGHDSQPYHCAVQYFSGEALVPQTPESSVPYCSGCPDGWTLLYDHRKNHDEWVDVGKLPDYPRGSSKIDGVENVYNSSVYLSRAECGTYGKNSVVNTWAMYAQMVQNPTEQILYRDMCAADSPVPYPYESSPDPFVEAECLQHVYGPKSKMVRTTGRPLRPPAPVGKRENSRAFRQSPFLDSFDVGFDTLGYYYVPDMCQPGRSRPAKCSLLINWHGCGGLHPWDWNGTLARYAESNGIVLLAPKMKRDNNVSLSFTNAREVARGCWDSYGQTGEDYATKSGLHIASGWRMVQRVLGV